jgi:2-oxoglutarate ferredoxin oxidoreductase subunit gamma
MEKFEHDVAPQGFMLYNSSLINKKDFKIKSYGVPINEISIQLGLPQAANMVMIGAYLEITKLFDDALIETIVRDVLGERKSKFIPINMKAVAAGRAYIKGLQNGI